MVVVVVVAVAVAVVVVAVAVVVASNARSASRERDNVGNPNKRTCIRTRIRTPDSVLVRTFDKRSILMTSSDQK